MLQDLSRRHGCIQQFLQLLRGTQRRLPQKQVVAVAEQQQQQWSLENLSQLLLVEMADGLSVDGRVHLRRSKQHCTQ